MQTVATIPIEIASASSLINRSTCRHNICEVSSFLVQAADETITLIIIQQA